MDRTAPSRLSGRTSTAESSTGKDLQRQSPNGDSTEVARNCRPKNKTKRLCHTGRRLAQRCRQVGARPHGRVGREHPGRTRHSREHRRCTEAQREKVKKMGLHALHERALLRQTKHEHRERPQRSALRAQFLSASTAATPARIHLSSRSHSIRGSSSIMTKLVEWPVVSNTPRRVSTL